MASSDGSITVTQQEFAQLQSQLLSLRTQNYQLTESETLLSATVKRLRDELAAALASAEAASSAADASSLYSSSLALLGLSSAPPAGKDAADSAPAQAQQATAAAAATASTTAAASQQQAASTGSLWGGLWGSSVDEEKENLKKTIAQQAEEHRLQISVLTQSIRELYVRNSALQCQLDELASPSTALSPADAHSPLNDDGSASLSSSAAAASAADGAGNADDSAEIERDDHTSAGDGSQGRSAAISIPGSLLADESHSELSEIDLGHDDSNDPTTTTTSSNSSSPEPKPALVASLLGSSPSTPSGRASLRTLNSSGSGGGTTLEQLIEDYQLELKAKSDQIAQHCKDKQLLKNELKIATQKIAHLTDQRNSDLEQLSSQQSRLAQLDLRINELLEALAASERRVKFLEGDAQQTQELLELTKTTKDQLAQQVLALTTQLESLQAKFEAGEDLLAASNATVAELNERLSAQSSGEGAEQVIAQLEAELQTVRSANEQLQQQLADGATASADTSSAVSELEERLAKLVAGHKFEVASLLEQLNVANAKLADAQLDSGETAQELLQRLNGALEQLAAAEQENAELAQESIGLKEELCRSQDDYEQECAALRSSIDGVTAARDLYQKEADELRTRLDDLQREQAIEERKNQRLVRELQQQLQKLSSSPSSPSSSPSSLPDTQSLQEETNNLLLRIGQMQEEKIQLQDEVRQLKQTNEKISVQLKKYKALMAGGAPMRPASRPVSPAAAASPSPSPSSSPSPPPPILEEDESSRLLIKIGEIQEHNNKLQEDNRRLRRMLAGTPPAKSSAVDVPARGRGSPAARGSPRPGQDKRSTGESPGLSFGLGKLFDMSN